MLRGRRRCIHGRDRRTRWRPELDGLHTEDELEVGHDDLTIGISGGDESVELRWIHQGRRQESLVGVQDPNGGYPASRVANLSCASNMTRNSEQFPSTCRETQLVETQKTTRRASKYIDTSDNKSSKYIRFINPLWSSNF